MSHVRFDINLYSSDFPFLYIGTKGHYFSTTFQKSLELIIPTGLSSSWKEKLDKNVQIIQYSDWKKGKIHRETYVSNCKEELDGRLTCTEKKTTKLIPFMFHIIIDKTKFISCVYLNEWTLQFQSIDCVINNILSTSEAKEMLKILSRQFLSYKINPVETVKKIIVLDDDDNDNEYFFPTHTFKLFGKMNRHTRFRLL